MMMATMMMAMNFMFISRAKISADRVMEIMDAEVDITDPVEPKLPEEVKVV